MCFLLAMTKNIGPFAPAAIQLSVLTGPYVALIFLAGLLRSHRLISLVLLVFTLAFSCVGVFAYSVEYAHFLERDPATPRGSNWMPFLLAVGQWFIMLCLAAILVPWFLYLKRKPKTASP